MWCRIRCHTGDSKRWGWKRRQTVVHGGSWRPDFGGVLSLTCSSSPSPSCLAPNLAAASFWACICRHLSLVALRLSPTNTLCGWLCSSYDLHPCVPTRCWPLDPRRAPDTCLFFHTLGSSRSSFSALYVRLIFCCPLTLSRCAHTWSFLPKWMKALLGRVFLVVDFFLLYDFKYIVLLPSGLQFLLKSELIALW